MLNKRDFFLFFLLCFVGVILTLTIYIPGSERGSYLEVSLNGKQVAVYPLNTDITTELDICEISDDSISEDSGHYNILQIKNGVATIIEANCRDKLCMYQRSIQSIGESIICLPHRLTFTVVSEDENAPDAVVY